MSSKTVTVRMDERDILFRGGGNVNATNVREEACRRSGLRNVTRVAYSHKGAASRAHYFVVTGELPERRWSRGVLIARRMRRIVWGGNSK